MDDKISIGLAKQAIRRLKKTETDAIAGAKMAIDELHEREVRRKNSNTLCATTHSKIAKRFMESRNSAGGWNISTGRAKNSLSFDKTSTFMQLETSTVPIQSTENISEDVITASLYALRTGKTEFAYGMGHIDVFFRHHCLARFIKRTCDKPEDFQIENFTKNLGRAILLANFTAIDARHPIRPVVVPLGTGLLLGYSFARDNTTAMDRAILAGIKKKKRGESKLPDSGDNALIYVNTFVDEQDLKPEQIAIRDRLRQFTDENEAALMTFICYQNFGAHARFFSKSMGNYGPVVKASEEYEDITRLSEWGEFANLQRRGVSKDFNDKVVQMMDEMFGEQDTGFSYGKLAREKMDAEIVRRTMDGETFVVKECEADPDASVIPMAM